jgi:hypothetical protein
MLVTASNFRVRGEKYDLTRGQNVSRFACGALFLPPIAGTFVGIGLNPTTAGFVARAGVHPAYAWVLVVVVACFAIETWMAHFAAEAALAPQRAVVKAVSALGGAAAGRVSTRR